MTLIEVVLGLVVLGTLVASLAIARGRALRQYAAADLQLRAARSAEAMLSGWLEGPPQAVPLRGGGPLADPPGCVWRTRPIRDLDAERLGTVVVRFEVADLKSPQARVLTIDFVVPRQQTSGN